MFWKSRTEEGPRLSGIVGAVQKMKSLVWSSTDNSVETLGRFYSTVYEYNMLSVSLGK